MSLHDKIMNLPVESKLFMFADGHREARHAAAELALQYDALIEQMAAALKTADALLYAHGKPVDPAITAALAAHAKVAKS